MKIDIRGLTEFLIGIATIIIILVLAYKFNL